MMEWKGIFPACTTKFDKDDNLDLPAMERSLKTQVKAGVDGIVLAGTLGESSVLTLAEREVLVKFSIEKMAGAVPVVVNIAEGATAAAVKQAKLLKEWGADGLMLLPPMRYKSDNRETVEYFKAVAQATDLPIMLYNNPIDYKTEITFDMFDELAELPTIQAVKESTRDVANVSRMINRYGKRFKVLCGVDTLALDELLLGADGWVAGLVCAFPAETVAVYRLAKAGKIQEAIQLFRWFMPLLELDIHVKLIQYIKLAEAETGLGTEIVRPPRLTLVGTERENTLKIIRDAIANRPSLSDYLSL
ncbi:4-hydroxy-tetrahydrodipicolinate synthase [Chitinophaga costaii]|uniref:4-hydroxy-tetrahydrodipicolinate synthase n=1 Tax=Chitinophaga costaii TaxID=1335309 RepID=A0A1C3YS16_9BACT|nr:dihydrodipicolinate synthase family protein [Chitinophaga costaii]PUZ30080.1 dihydrodipicolinate synthase family protein [Chitinophaga costaii]SCB72894.1 4-hydroxy-tetrahydrodipicolinate synthase [Chitinophaga costaii]